MITGDQQSSLYDSSCPSVLYRPTQALPIWVMDEIYRLILCHPWVFASSMKSAFEKMSKHAAQPLNLNTIPPPEILEGLLILPPPRPHLSPFNSPTFFRHFFSIPSYDSFPSFPLQSRYLLFHQPLFPSTLIFRVKVMIINYHIQKFSVMKYTCKESSPASQSSYPSLSCSLFLQPL